MDTEFEQPAVTADDPAERSLVDDLRQLAGDAREAAQAEVAFQQSRAKVVGASAGGIAARAVVALALVFFALMALVVGLLLALTPVLTAWGATALVVVVLLVGAAILAMSARAGWRRLTALVNGEDRA
jgi:hypothetical protein